MVVEPTVARAVGRVAQLWSGDPWQAFLIGVSRSFMNSIHAKNE